MSLMPLVERERERACFHFSYIAWIGMGHCQQIWGYPPNIH
jgi:hypothetical protein